MRDKGHCPSFILAFFVFSSMTKTEPQVKIRKVKKCFVAGPVESQF